MDIEANKVVAMCGDPENTKPVRPRQVEPGRPEIPWHRAIPLSIRPFTAAGLAAIAPPEPTLQGAGATA